MALPPFEKKINAASWITALFLSPGILFLSGYLAIYGSLSLYMNSSFKQQLLLHYKKTTGNTYTISVKSIRPAFVLNAITISSIELQPTTLCPKNQRNHLLLNKLELGFPDLEKIPFSRQKLQESTTLICKKIADLKKSDQ
ncbi:MAG: hypothetical protein HGA57_04520 [Chlorobium limicola]|jgi:hypothetical protein|uniref:Uncharacterized protein n=1 Tax=Chlorobium limicola (strain DSM 245 / NBRC 103803 / 6330) TaxID=290315 RepID=B3EE15_CHLL2|nr:hypothetical protein [Chlorobium limicola]ACD90717.1 conserved hypothetical protein [Chlorobium limicola DSM 245]NTV20638.1 hypothetical protein [Chlorobium limicola]